MGKRLYRVTCRGMHTGVAGEPAFGIAYVIAYDPADAYEKVRSALNVRGLGFPRDRELLSVELLAKDDEYPDCGTVLYP